MRRVPVYCATVAAVIGLTFGTASAAPAAESVRAGDLAVQLARAAGVRLPAGDAERVAAAFLKARGVVLAPTLDTPLSEGDLVLVAERLGLNVTTRTPGGAVSAAGASAFVGAARASLRADANGNGGVKDGDINASCRGREARAGRRGTPASPADPNATAPPCQDDEEPQP